MPEYTVELADPDTREARQLLASLSATLEQLTGSSGTASFDASDVTVARSCFAIARDSNGDALACGALRPLDQDTAELKRMFALPGTQGAGQAVLAFLEQQASAFGYTRLWLETRRVNLRAIAFYQRNGYVTIDNYGRYVDRPEAICLGKNSWTGHVDDI